MLNHEVNLLGLRIMQEAFLEALWRRIVVPCLGFRGRGEGDPPRN